MPADFFSRNVPASSKFCFAPPEMVASIDFDTADVRQAQKQDSFCILLQNFIKDGS